MTIDNLKQEFENRFHQTAEHAFFCPGRVNLIGEHIDYNGGMVMPCAITMGTTLLVSKNSENAFRFRTVNFPETADCALQSGYAKQSSDWFNYPLGVIHEFLKAGVRLEGLNFLFSGNLPIGSGLSSSASIEVLTAHALNQLFNNRAMSRTGFVR